MTPEELELDKKPAKEVNQELLIDVINEENTHNPIIKIIIISVIVIFVIAFGINWGLDNTTIETKSKAILFLTDFFDAQLIHFLIIGVLAQIVDGALGMAYGATATAFLTSSALS